MFKKKEFLYNVRFKARLYKIPHRKIFGNLSRAILLAQHERWNSCINRLYYSSFYLISALLYQNNIKAETHNGTKIQFFLEFIKSEKINKKYGKFYSHLFDWRQETDYADFMDFDKETATSILEQTKVFNETIAKLIQK